MVLSIQTLCCDTHIFNSGAVHFFWSSLRWFYTFIESSCVDYTDWTWLGKPHTCLYKTLQLTVHVRAMRIMRSKELPEELRDRIVARHRSGQGYKKMSAALKVPKSTVASIILKWKTLGRPEPFIELASGQTELSGEKSLGERGKEEPKDHCGWAPEMHSGDGRKL